MNKSTGHIFYRNLRKFYPTAARGEGIYIFDTEGKKYIDGSGGAAVVGIGHGVKEITEAMVRQAEKISFAHSSQFTSQSTLELAEQLAQLAPEGLNKVYFLSGGSEAIETAVKMARQYQVERGKPEKYKVISRWTSYHGNTLGALALSGHSGRRQLYLPLMLPPPISSRLTVTAALSGLRLKNALGNALGIWKKPFSMKGQIPCPLYCRADCRRYGRGSGSPRMDTSKKSGKFAIATMFFSSPTK